VQVAAGVFELFEVVLSHEAQELLDLLDFGTLE
jgi:hypothetical protein